MNHTYRLIFNRRLGLWQVVSELAKGHGKGRGQSSTVSATSSGTRLPIQERQATWLHHTLRAALLAMALSGQAHADSFHTGEILWDRQNLFVGKTGTGAQRIETVNYGTAYHESRSVILGHEISGIGTISVSGLNSSYHLQPPAPHQPTVLTVGNAGTEQST